MTSITHGKVTRGKTTKGGLLDSAGAEAVENALTAARAIDGARNSAFPDGPTVEIGDTSLGAYSWAALAEGNELVVHTDGTNDFGSGPDQAKILYDEFDGGTDGADIDLVTTQGEDWDDFSTFTPRYEATSPHSGSLCMRTIDKDVRRALYKAFSTPITEVFAAFAIRTPDGGLFPYAINEDEFTSSSVLKVLWLLGVGDSTVLSDMIIASRINSQRFILSGNDLTFSLDAVENDEWQWDTGANDGGWNYWSCWLEADATNPATVAGKAWFQSIREGVGQNPIVEDDTQPIFEGSDEVDGGDESAVDWHSMYISSYHREQYDRVDQAWRFDDSAGTYADETADANSDTANDVQHFPAGAGADDCFFLGQGPGPNQEPFGGTPTAQKFNEVEVDIGTPGAGTYTITWEYWNGSTWAALSNVTDDSNNLKATAGAHIISFDIPGDWAETTVNGSSSLYFVRGRRDSGTVTTDPLLDDVDLINRVNKDKTNLDVDSVYLAWGENANARVVFTDNATFTSATKGPNIPHTSWASDKVLATLRKSSHSSLSGVHVHLVKADNTRLYVGQLS